MPSFGESSTDDRIMRTVTRCGDATIDAQGSCQSALYDREEEIYFVLQGNGALRYGEQTYAMHANDFTYLPPGVKHAMANSSEKALRVLIMAFRIPPSISIHAAMPRPQIVNLYDLKEKTV